MNWRRTLITFSILTVLGLALAGIPGKKLGQPLTQIVEVAEELFSEKLFGKEDPAEEPVCFSTALSRISAEHGVPPRLVEAIILVESEGNPRAISRKGAMGLMQLMPSVLKAYQVEDPFDPVANVEAGVRHLKYLLQEFSGNLSLALAAYNAGPANVRKYGGIPPFPETKKYLKSVLNEYESGRNEWILVSPFLKIKMDPGDKPTKKKTPEKGINQLFAFYQKPLSREEGVKID